MSTSMDNLRNDVHKPAEQLEREADSARSAVEGTLADLQQRLSPGEMVDRAMDMVKRHGGEFGDNLLTQVRNNPIPTIIAGVGVAWLMAASKRRPPHGNWQGRYGDGRYEGDEDIDATESWASAATSAHHATTAGADAMQKTARAATDSVRDAAESVADSVRGTAASTAKSAKAAAYRAAEASRKTADRVADVSRTSVRGITDGYAYLCREQPFVLGAIAVATGAALGALFRSTSAEDSLFGETSDSAKARLKSEADARAGELRDAATAALETVRDKVSETGAGDGDVETTDQEHAQPQVPAGAGGADPAVH